ncbi:hypothetical protein B7494_g6388 [Chlorociboria aeruginascens]|nr:hypothetical protein B7494_g6388 [Chlorociboria aeruginascens]
MTDSDSLITIDNYGEKMGRFSLQEATKANNSLYALVDIGSNGIRFSISDLLPPQTRLLPCLYRERVGISLYDALHESAPDSQTFYFSTHIIEQVSRTIGRFKSICDKYSVPHSNITVFATEAMRTARNRETILKAIKGESTLKVEILSPAVESLFGAMGARSSFHHVDGLFMDLGGGSVQMTYVDSASEEYYTLAAEAATSMPFGAAKLKAALSTQSATNTKEELVSKMAETFEKLGARFPRLQQQTLAPEGINIYFCGGGFRGYGSMLMHTDPIKPYPIPIIGGYTVPGYRFSQTSEMLLANNFEGKIFGMSKRRREQFPAIVAVVEALVAVIPTIGKVIFCAGGNREGALLMKLSKEIRESNPLLLLSSPDLHPHCEPVLRVIVSKLITALPDHHPKIFDHKLLYYFAQHTWVNTGAPDDENSSKSLHDPITGLLSGFPGLDHSLRAIIALTMCARWGNVLAPIHTPLHSNLRDLVTHETAWWCEYIGSLLRFLASIYPVFPSCEAELENVVFDPRCDQGLGKKGDKVVLRLHIALTKEIKNMVGIGAVLDGLEGVGKKLKSNWRFVRMC